MFKIKTQLAIKTIAALLLSAGSTLPAKAQSVAAAKNGKYFDRAIIVIFENTNYSAAMKEPFFKELATAGANFSNFLAVAHPSQGNYVALTSRAINGVKGDGNYNLDVKNIVDLLEAKGLTWKVYAENYPGNCFTGGSSGNYARKHNPFISYVDIQKNPTRCANIVEAAEFDKDAAAGALPDYVFYVPNLKHDGHDTGVAFADTWYRNKFSPYLQNSKFMANTVLISTFDESGGSSKNQIYTSINGPAVNPKDYSDALGICSLLQMMEDNWNLGSLGKNDATAAKIPSIWK